MSDQETRASFAEVFRQALADRSMSLTELRRTLDENGIRISLATLSYWRSASRQPHADTQRETIAEVERILDLEPGALGLRAAHPRPVVTAVESYLSAAEIPDGVEARLVQAERDLQIDPTEWIQEVSQQQITDVGVDGHLRSTTIRAALCCVEGALHRVLWLVAAPHGDTAAIQVTVVGGGKEVGRWIDPDGWFIATAVEFDEPLQVGETGMLEVRTDYLDGAVTDMGVGVFSNRATRRVINWVRFHPQGIPDWFLEVEETSLGTTRCLRVLDSPTSIHQARWDFGPGAIRLEWGYGQPPEDPNQV